MRSEAGKGEMPLHAPYDQSFWFRWRLGCAGQPELQLART